MRLNTLYSLLFGVGLALFVGPLFGIFAYAVVSQIPRHPLYVVLISWWLVALIAGVGIAALVAIVVMTIGDLRRGRA